MIICRNVLIYFNTILQNRVINLFTNSLVSGGFLALGNKETLNFSDAVDKYAVISQEQKIYRKLYLP